jgi:hypothetical protein
MEPKYSYIFKDSNELGDVILKYHEICITNSKNSCSEGHEIANKYIIDKYGNPE